MLYIQRNHPSMTTLQGKSEFSAAEAAVIEKTLFDIRRSERKEQKASRDKLRGMGFFISDYTTSKKGFTVAHFRDLIKEGTVKIK